MKDVADMVFLRIYVRPGDGDDRRKGKGINHVEWLFQMGEEMLRAHVEREIVRDDGESGVFAREAIAAVDPHPVYGLIVHVSVFRQDSPKAVVRLVRDHQNIVPFLCPFLTHGGDGESFRMIMWRDDENLHPRYYRTTKEKFLRACIMNPPWTGKSKRQGKTP